MKRKIKVYSPNGTVIKEIDRNKSTNLFYKIITPLLISYIPIHIAFHNINTTRQETPNTDIIYSGIMPEPERIIQETILEIQKPVTRIVIQNSGPKLEEITQSQTKEKTNIEELCKYHGIETEVKSNIRRISTEYKKTMEGILTDATRFEDYFINSENKTGLNSKLVESVVCVEAGHTGFSFEAESPVGAKGLPQFMKITARSLGQKIIEKKIKKNGKTKTIIVYDERQDPESIIDAAGYLKNLIKTYNGDMVLALAAYNIGPTNLSRIIKKKGTNKFTELFKSGTETKDYVIKVLSRLEILKNPEKYGLEIGKKALYSEIRTNAVEHVIRKGETLYSLCKKYNSTVPLVEKANPAIISYEELPTGITIYFPNNGKIQTARR